MSDLTRLRLRLQEILAQMKTISDIVPPPMTNAAYRTVNPQGRFPALILCDHASRALPPSYDGLGVAEAELRRHIGWDIGAADVTERLAAKLDAPAILSGWSRLLVDCNRDPRDQTLCCPESDGTIVPGNRNMTDEERERRLALYFTPYHQAIADMLQDMQTRIPVPALISIHSFTPVMQGQERPWHVGILWDKDGRLPLPLMAGLRADGGLVVGDNEPYDGRQHVGYTTRRHAEPLGLPHVLIEIRQDLIDTHDGAEAWAERLARHFSAIFAKLAPFTRTQISASASAS